MTGMSLLALSARESLLLAERNDSSLLLSGIVIGGGVLAMLGAVVWFRHYRLRHQQSHAALFDGLCEAHELDRASRRLLSQVIRFHRLCQPARLFTEPQWLEPSRLGGALASRAAEVTALRNRLFAVAVTVPR